MEYVFFKEEHIFIFVNLPKSEGILILIFKQPIQPKTHFFIKKIIEYQT